MAATRKLSADDRQFLSLVASAVFANPFSDDRAEIDAAISGGSPREPYAARVQRVLARLTERLARLDAREKTRLDQFRGQDRDVLTYALLFEIYHRFKDEFDRLIERQFEAGDASCPVSFARDAVADLEQRGFHHQEALRDFALFYQLRRAFYFIDRALIGTSACMKELRLNLWNNVFTSDSRWYNSYLWNRMEEFSTLLIGETGTGKGSAAGSIGRSGFIPLDEKKGRFVESFTKTFVSLNLSQFPEALIESELFGHRKGAFTGAVENHRGVFSTCSGCGSIFLDEIGEVSTQTQIKLLRVVEERVFSPVGSHEKERFRGRVISATNRPLKELRGGGLFRDDFFYRLCSDVIVLPPLRQRIAEDPGELEALVRHTLHRTLGEDGPELVGRVVTTIDGRLGRDYPWPGNVRELEQCVRRILLKGYYDGDKESLSADLRGRLLERIDAGKLNASDLVEAYCALLYSRFGSYEQVARVTELDRRTVKKYVTRWESSE